jgi:hypothetical protein
MWRVVLLRDRESPRNRCKALGCAFTFICYSPLVLDLKCLEKLRDTETPELDLSTRFSTADLTGKKNPSLRPRTPIRVRDE